MNVEDLKPGDAVGLLVWPGCPGEFLVHGIAPIVNKQQRSGWFIGIEESSIPGHRYKVGYKDGGWDRLGWFSAEELITP